MIGEAAHGSTSLSISPFAARSGLCDSWLAKGCIMHVIFNEESASLCGSVYRDRLEHAIGTVSPDG